jgi:hypothetical protein
MKSRNATPTELNNTSLDRFYKITSDERALSNCATTAFVTQFAGNSPEGCA